MLPSPRYEQVLAAILESAEEAIVGIALDGSIELWSRGAEHLYGYAADEEIGVALFSLLPIYEGLSLQAVLEAAREGKMTDSETVERLHKLGTKLSVGVRRMAMRDERGEVTGILEIGRPRAKKRKIHRRKHNCGCSWSRCRCCCGQRIRTCGSRQIGVPVCSTPMYMRETW